MRLMVEQVATARLDEQMAGKLRYVTNPYGSGL